MSLIYKYRCDGCKKERVNLPKDWKTVETWDDGSVTLHYCRECRGKGR